MLWFGSQKAVCRLFVESSTIIARDIHHSIHCVLLDAFSSFLYIKGGRAMGQLNDEELGLCKKAFAQFDKDGETVEAARLFRPRTAQQHNSSDATASRAHRLRHHRRQGDENSTAEHGSYTVR